MTDSSPNPPDPLPYQRCRFATSIPRDRLYTPDHYWLKQQEPGLWRVGLTAWAVRMLGDFVEHRFDVVPGALVRPGEVLGSLEAFKALAEIRSAAAGTFAGGNPILHTNLDAIAQDCHGIGWLYEVRGTADADVCDAEAYRVLLDETIDAMRGYSG